MEEKLVQSFSDEIRSRLRAGGIDPDAPIPQWSELYESIESRANRKQLRSTALALPLVRWILYHAVQNPNGRFSEETSYRGYYTHALAVCHMLIDLHVPISREEEDVLLAAALCHILPETIHSVDLHGELVEKFTLEEAVYQTVAILYRDDDNTPQGGEKRFFDRIAANKLALLIKLADRGNLVEQLYGISGWTARSYIHETRSFFFPLCIYAKDRYPDLLAPVSVLLEKMRSLTDLSEILLSRYEAREQELSMEILALEEENRALKRMLGR